jgi:hypothetical protein
VNGGVKSNLRIEPTGGGGGRTLGGMIADESCYRLSNVARRFKIAEHSLLVTFYHNVSTERSEFSRFRLPLYRIAATGGGGGGGGGEIGGRRQHCTAACHPAACGTRGAQHRAEHSERYCVHNRFPAWFIRARGREQEGAERVPPPPARASHLSNFSKCDNFTQTFKFRRPLFLGPELWRFRTSQRVAPEFFLIF